ncbi:hypothetical protein M413DRAFT_440107 [Hebeloma cylindrosporum]|uniref:Uncharacterized protein n=1 Tax=Hebeloma cylindrosporum TaxID=76867 RepID=A0A0C2YF12_HEBCY|nr:hypothetical protein M413DRAFT_440107 [Hebeloma cylindrosporum h7]
MTASLEQQKQLYSKQLAAYTLRQWNIVQQRDEERSRNEKPSTSAESQTGEGEDQGVAPGDRENTSDGETTPGVKQKTDGNKSRIQAIDFGFRRNRPKNNSSARQT